MPRPQQAGPISVIKAFRSLEAGEQKITLDMLKYHMQEDGLATPVAAPKKGGRPKKQVAPPPQEPVTVAAV